MSATNALAAALGAGAALLFTVSFALQQRANLVVMRSGGTGARPVMARPEWIAGIGLQLPAFGLQAMALGIGAFAVVQPALITQLVFMVPAGAWVVHARTRGRDLVAPAVVLVGLVTFELATRPEPGVEAAARGDWVGPLLLLCAVFVGCFAAGQALPAYRAALRGAAVGVWGAVLGALAKQVIGTGADGAAALAGSWALWALVSAGIVNLLWVNLALRSGSLVAALVTMSSLTPAASVFLAVTVFDEQLRGGVWAVSAASLGAVLCVVGTAFVARSPSLLALEATTPTGHPGVAGTATAVDHGVGRGGPA